MDEPLVGIVDITHTDGEGADAAIGGVGDLGEDALLANDHLMTCLPRGTLKWLELK